MQLLSLLSNYVLETIKIISSYWCEHEKSAKFHTMAKSQFLHSEGMSKGLVNTHALGRVKHQTLVQKVHDYVRCCLNVISENYTKNGNRYI